MYIRYKQSDDSLQNNSNCHWQDMMNEEWMNGRSKDLPERTESDIDVTSTEVQQLRAVTATSRQKQKSSHKSKAPKIVPKNKVHYVE